MQQIVWALDPARKAEDSKNLVRELRTWQDHLGCGVQPVSILFKSIFNWPSEIAFPDKEMLLTGARESVDQHIKKCGATSFLPPEILFVPSLSTRKMALTLADYAHQKKALLVFANTRANKGWNPFRLGGFAETLITTSKVPVLLLNPKAQPSQKISSILVPTDFGRESKNALANLAPWAKSLSAKIMLYNQVETLSVYSADSYNGWGPGVLNLEPAMRAIEKSRSEKAKAWSKKIKDQSIDCTAIVEWEKKDLAESIVKTAKKQHADLIALSSHRGPLAQAILGSVARDVLVKAKSPVLVFYRPKAIKKSISKREKIMTSPSFQEVHHGSERT